MGCGGAHKFPEVSCHRDYENMGDRHRGCGVPLQMVRKVQGEPARTSVEINRPTSQGEGKTKSGRRGRLFESQPERRSPLPLYLVGRKKDGASEAARPQGWGQVLSGRKFCTPRYHHSHLDFS